MTAPAPASSEPSPTGATSASTEPAGPTDQPTEEYRGHYVFPIDPPSRAGFGHVHHDYPATDIFAPCGTPAVAPIDGTVLEVSRTDHWDPKVNRGDTRGGLSFSLRGDDGVRYYGSHLRSLGTDIGAGSRVRAGRPLGEVGNTGDAAGIACHLHFGISPPCGVGDWQVRRGAVYPWPYLESWRRGGQRSPAPAVATFARAHPCHR